MAEGKKSFLLYTDLLYTVEQLPDDMAGKLFKHILEYVNDKNPETDDLVLKVSFEPIKQQLKRDLKKFENICEQRSDSGTLGNLKRWNEDLFTQVTKKQISLKEALEIANNRKNRKRDKIIAKIADNDNDNDNDIIKKNKQKKVIGISLEDKNKEYFPLAKQLSKIVKENKNISIQLHVVKNWSNDIRLLTETSNIDIPRIEKVLDWYSKNIGKEYIPIILSGNALRTKFLALESAMERNEKKTTPVSPVRFKSRTQSYRDPDEII